MRLLPFLILALVVLSGCSQPSPLCIPSDTLVCKNPSTTGTPFDDNLLLLVSGFEKMHCEGQWYIHIRIGAANAGFEPAGISSSQVSLSSDLGQHEPSRPACITQPPFPFQRIAPERMHAGSLSFRIQGNESRFLLQFESKTPSAPDVGFMLSSSP